ncbi:hypothetical protein ACF1G0_03630 [Streptomyces sp. NPDC013953]|uniref:hypothetical protein n=1 Tax=Streptomyces sp. NPDC013953 TaxID=3364868 RepID=UPI0036F6DB5A
MRRIAAVVLGTVTFLGFTATAASAVALPDPATVVDCVTTSATDLTTVVDPASLAVPPEVPAVPGTGCLAV